MPITIQPAQTADAAAPYDVHQPLPYPYHIEEDGKVGRQDFWRGTPYSLIGFQRGRREVVVLAAEDFVRDPDKALGLCAVFLDEDGSIWADTRPITKVNRYERTPE